LNATIILAMLGFAGARVLQVVRQQPEVEARQFPERAVAFLNARPYATTSLSLSVAGSRIFNSYDWGGYLIWKSNPEVPVFIDGRADLYGEALFHDFADAYQFRDGWRQILEGWRVETVLVPSDSALAIGLRASPGWTIAYADSQATILTAPRETLGIVAPADQRGH
jgi:hypothetical protein